MDLQRPSSVVRTFADFALPDELIVALAEQGITEPFPIQVATIEDALAGRDVLGRGRTGSGKTLAFVLPLLARLAASDNERRSGAPRAVILAPTRELANQIRDVVAPLAKELRLRYTTVYGGVAYNGQITALRNGVDIVVACPGRMIDLMESRHMSLDDVEITVLDEADHMAELGFLEHVREILSHTPENGQRLLFSATLDRGIDKLVRQFLHEPATHEVDEEEIPADAMTHHILHVDNNDRIPVITDLCAAPGRSMVFTRTKHGARRLAEQLVKSGVPAVELHGDLSQAKRARNLAAFSSGVADTLVATDIAARGIHVDNVALVIHADPPAEPKAFLHRSGRTARAGESGVVVTMMTDQQRRGVKRLARDAGIEATTTRVDAEHDLLSDIAPGERVFREMQNLDTIKPQRHNGEGRTGGRGNGRRQGSGQRRNSSRRSSDRFDDSRDRSERSRDERGRDERSRDDNERPRRERSERSWGDRNRDRTERNDHRRFSDNRERGPRNDDAPRRDDSSVRDGWKGRSSDGRRPNARRSDGPRPDVRGERRNDGRPGARPGARNSDRRTDRSSRDDSRGGNGSRGRDTGRGRDAGRGRRQHSR
jgi:superfamily II DNA/RNA helicase